SATELLAAIDAQAERRPGASDAAATAVDRAEEWLMQQFEEGDTVRASEVKSRAGMEGIAWRTVERAKVRLGIGVRRENAPGGGGAGWWVGVAPRLGGRAGEEDDGGEARTAKQIPLATLASSERGNGSNAAPPADTVRVPKTAKGKTAAP